MEAGKILAANFIHAVIKTIKFKENPTIDELIMEIKLVNNKFLFIYSAVKNWTINVKRKI
jgi:bisphosphoglycerate-independent phosphoglycerate mutase (AlkP superfamily)